MNKSASAFRTISEVAAELDLPQHVLRFWETKFPSIKPMKRGGGRRYYRPEDILLLNKIRGWLYDDGYTIKGVQKLLKEKPSTQAGDENTTELNQVAGKVTVPAGAGTPVANPAALREILAELKDIRDSLN